MKKILTALLTLLFIVPALSAITPAEIIDKMEENQVYDTSRVVGRMITTDKYGTIERTFVSYARGDDESLIEFTSIEEEGQKILRTANEIYLYFPDAEELIRIQGAALRDAIMDSDFSYEDMTGEKSLLDTYDITLEDTDLIDGAECYRLKLVAKKRGVAYPQEILWVDTEMFVYRRVHKFSRSGELLKEMHITDFARQDGLTIPTRIVMSDKLKKNSQTEFIVEEIEIGITLDPKLFSLEELTF